MQQYLGISNVRPSIARLALKIKNRPVRWDVFSRTAIRRCGRDLLRPFSASARIPIDQELAGIPSLKPARDLPIPELRDTVLPSGIRVATVETYDQVSCMGVFVNSGSMQETAANNGVSSIIEKLAFSGTQRRTGQHLQILMEKLGASPNTLLSKDIMIYQVEVLRDSVEAGVEILCDAVQHPNLDPEGILAAKQMVEFQKEDLQYEPQLIINELIHEAAFGKRTPLGQPLMCPSGNINTINEQTLSEYFRDFYTCDNIVVVGTSVDHDDFCSYVERYMTELNPTSKTEKIPAAKYEGGEVLLESKPMVREVSTTFVDERPEFAHVGLAFATSGWHGDDLIPVCVLHTLLGGGSSFSAGGPGKGMYSRLYTEILNKCYYAESALSTAVMYSDVGLFGVYGSAEPKHVGQLLGNLATQVDILADSEPNELELSRARNQLKSSMLMNLESRLILCEDIGKQILMYGNVKSTHDLCSKIDKITPQDIKSLVQKLLAGNPSYAMYGNLGVAVPVRYPQIQYFFGSRRSARGDTTAPAQS